MISLETSTRFNASISRVSKRDGRGALALALLATLFFVLAPTAQARVALYKVDHRMASDLMPYAEASMGNEGTVQLDPTRNSILLVGDDEPIERTLILLKAQDTAPRMIRLQYEHVRQEELSEYGLGIQWKGNYGHVILGEENAGGKKGLHVRWPDEGLYVRWRARKKSSEDRFQGELTLLEGRSGRIVTGRSVPMKSHSINHDTPLDFIVAESGFEAQPTVLGNGKIRLEIQAFQGEIQRNGRVEFTDASTLILLSPGQSVVLGGIGQESSQAEPLHGLSSKERSRDQLLMITASFVDEEAVDEATADEVTVDEAMSTESTP